MKIIFKTLDQIKTNLWWTNDYIETDNDLSSIPKREEWYYDKALSVTDIKLWEQLYFQPGILGVYASWDPYAEFYIVVHNLFLDTDIGIISFYGKDAANKLTEYLKSYEIVLPIFRSYVEDKDVWLYKDM
jgi:hypothetical protein